MFADINLVQNLLSKTPDQISGINFRLSDGVNVESVRGQLQEFFGPKVSIKSRRELNSTLYRMLNTENLATYLIFTLVLIIALFNVVGAIIMMILDQTTEYQNALQSGFDNKGAEANLFYSRGHSYQSGRVHWSFTGFLTHLVPTGFWMAKNNPIPGLSG